MLDIKAFIRSFIIHTLFSGFLPNTLWFCVLVNYWWTTTALCSCSTSTGARSRLENVHFCITPCCSAPTRSGYMKEGSKPAELFLWLNKTLLTTRQKLTNAVQTMQVFALIFIVLLCVNCQTVCFWPKVLGSFISLKVLGRLSTSHQT